MVDPPTTDDVVVNGNVVAANWKISDLLLLPTVDAAADANAPDADAGAITTISKKIRRPRRRWRLLVE